MQFLQQVDELSVFLGCQAGGHFIQKGDVRGGGGLDQGPTGVGQTDLERPAVIGNQGALDQALFLQPAQQHADGVLADVLALAEVRRRDAFAAAAAFLGQQPKQQDPTRP